MKTITFQTLFSTLSILFLLGYYYIIGYLISDRIIKRNKKFLERINENILTGMISNILFLYTWNLFFPINSIGFILFFSVCFLIRMRTRNFHLPNFSLRNINQSFIIFILMCSIWLGFLCNNPVGPYDLGLYHLQVIKWLENYKIIHGIGNLHHRLGFSCGSWLLTAQFNVFFKTNSFLWTHGSIYLLIGLINFFYIPIFSKEKICKNEKIIRILFLPLLFQFSFYSFPGTSSDLPVFLFTALLLFYFYDFFYLNKKDSIDMIFIVSVLGISSKLSFGLVIIGLLIVLIIFWLKRLPFKICSFRIILLSFITLLLWSYRNIIMTGYPLYPSTVVSLPVEWKMDDDYARIAGDIVKTYPWGHLINVPSDEYNHTKILEKIMPQHRRVEVLFPIILGLIGMGYLVIFERNSIIRIIILSSPSIIPIIMWIYIPQNRFFTASFWWFGSIFSFSMIKVLMRQINYNYFYLLILTISISFHIFDYLGSPKIFFPAKVRPKIPSVGFQEVVNSKGLNYFRPDNKKNCWDTPIPCSSELKYLIKDVVLIDEDNLSGGFKVSGQ